MCTWVCHPLPQHPARSGLREDSGMEFSASIARGGSRGPETSRVGTVLTNEKSAPPGAGDLIFQSDKAHVTPTCSVPPKRLGVC